MTRIDLVTPIAAPPDRCFDLARSVDAHVRSSRGTRERAIAGRTTGLLELGDEVTSWLAGHFRRYLERRNRVLKELAETDAWKEFVP